MRNLSSGNKINFTMFAFIVLVIIVIMIGGLLKGLQNVKEKYQISKNVCVYDNKYNYINLESEAEISKKWTNSYYLKENETKKEYNLGKYSIAYNETRKSLDLFGTFYQVIKGGNVEKITEHNVVNNTQDSRFYKIEDRKYLIVGKVIKNNSETLTTFNYLIIILDKSGNALLLNDSINAKTINQMVISTDDFKFDVANEKLFFNEEEIDLKKIIGSSNEYVEVAKEEPEKQNATENNEEKQNEAETEEKKLQTIETVTTKTEIQNDENTIIIENNVKKNQDEAQQIANNKDEKNSAKDEVENIIEKDNHLNESKNNEVTEENDKVEENITKPENQIQEENKDKEQSNGNNGETKSEDNKEERKPEDNKEEVKPENNKEETNQEDNEEDANSWVGSLNAWINSVASGFKSLYNKSQNKKEDTSLNRSICLKSLSSGTSYIDIEYSINDPDNKYNVVYATISNETETKSISLSKDSQTYRATGLKPNTDYTVQMGYKIIYSSAETEETIEDTMNIRTKAPNESLKITRVSTDKVYYTLKLDSNFTYDEDCKIVVYLNDETEISSIPLNNNILSRAASTGYLGSFNLPKEYKTKNSSIKIVLEDTKVDGMTINTNLMSKIVNY